MLALTRKKGAQENLMGRLHPAPQLPLIRSKGRKGQENVKVTNAA